MQLACGYPVSKCQISDLHLNPDGVNPESKMTHPCLRGKPKATKLKSHLPTALTLIPGKEPGGAISFTTKDQHNNIPQHHLFIPLESWALCIPNDSHQLMHGASWLQETVAPHWKSAPKREGMSLHQAQFPQTSVLHNLPSLQHFCRSYMIPMLSP